MDPFGFLDNLFGGGGDGGFSTTQGGAPLNLGFSAVQGWAVGQAFSNAGPIGQYLGLLYGSPGTGLPNVGWERQQAGLPIGGQILVPDAGDQGAGGGTQGGGTNAPVADDAAPSQPTRPARTLDTLERDGSVPSAENNKVPITEVTVLGMPRDWPPIGSDWREQDPLPPPRRSQDPRFRFLSPPTHRCGRCGPGNPSYLNHLLWIPLHHPFSRLLPIPWMVARTSRVLTRCPTRFPTPHPRRFPGCRMLPRRPRNFFRGGPGIGLSASRIGSPNLCLRCEAILDGLRPPPLQLLNARSGTAVAQGWRRAHSPQRSEWGL